MIDSTITIVGASLAGLSAAEALRRLGFDGGIRVVGEEKWLPYDRPPLSKDLLRTGITDGPPYLRDDVQYAGLGVDWVLGRRCLAVDPLARKVKLDDGTSIAFHSLIIATGARPRRLSSMDGVGGVHLLRTYDDSLALAGQLVAASNVVVVGGGFIGCEVAASLRQRGLEVTLVEPFPTLLFGPLGPQVGELVSQLHRDAGVRLVLNVGVSGYRGRDHVEAVVLSDGTEIPADTVIIGLGAVPNTEWLEGSGIAVDNGIVCDAYGRTAAEGIYAAGDVAGPQSLLHGRRIRLEHWTSASVQGAAVAANLLGSEPTQELVRVPYFWSDQFGHRLNYLGLHDKTDRVHIHRSDDGTWEAVWERGGVITAVAALGNPRLLVRMRRMLAQPLEDHWPMEASHAARLA